MGQVSSKKIIILILCFVLTGFFIHQSTASVKSEKPVSLNAALSEISGWKAGAPIPMDPDIVQALELDDYINRSYSNGEDRVSLYIGYYYSKGKIGAAHDPLVCFPGQGWKVSATERDRLLLNRENEKALSFSRMFVQRGDDKLLIIYWFQSYDTPNPDTFSQKISSLKNKIMGLREDNAFVRISIPVGQESTSDHQKTVMQFIRAFYPEFLEFVKS